MTLKTTVALAAAAVLLAAPAGAAAKIIEIGQTDSPMVEEEWRLFASASAAAGVRSTLSFPLLYQDEVVGGVNLYASTTDAFASLRTREALGSSCHTLR